MRKLFVTFVVVVGIFICHVAMADTYTVTYSCGDGTGNPPASATATSGTSFTSASNTCTRDGYTFASWGVSDSPVSRIANRAFTWNYTEDKTFTAQWIENGFTVTTTNLAAGDTFTFKIAATGTLTINCGEGGTLSGTGVSGTSVSTGSSSQKTYTCTYSTGGVKTIRFNGSISGSVNTYSTSQSIPCISFEGNTKVAAIGGDLLTVFLATGGSLTQHPRFYNTFKGCTNLTSIADTMFKKAYNVTTRAKTFYHTFDGCTGLTTLPTGMFDGIVNGTSSYESSYPSTNVFEGTFYGCTGLTSLPDGMFGNVSLAKAGMFYQTFYGCTNLSGYIPPTAFETLIANGAPTASNMWYQTFDGTNLDTTCPPGTADYITGYESSWDGKVSCEESYDPETQARILYVMNGGMNYSGAPKYYTFGTAETVDGIPTRASYTFAGWCTDAELQNCAMSQTIDTTATGDKTFYAKWTACTACATTNTSCSLSVVSNVCTYTTSCNTGYENIQDNGAYNASCTPITYDVTYVMNGGTNYSGAPTTHTYGTTVTIDGTPTKTGKVFIGWCTDSGLTNCAMSQTISATTTGDQTFYAKWGQEYTVTYACGTGTTGEPPASATAVSDTPFTPAANNTCAKIGHTFNGWNDGTTDRPAGTAYTYNYNDDVTLTAKWTVNTYTITLENVSLVPSGYTQLDYLQSTGTQYINTGIAPGADTKWVLDNEFTATPSSFYNGVYDNGPNPVFRFDIGLNTSGLMLNYGPLNYVTSSYSSFVNQRNTYVVDALNMKWAYGNTEGNLPAYDPTGTTARTIYIFARRSSSTEAYSKQKTYSSKIYKNNALVQELIPARRNSDNVLGMYDTVGNTFKTNSGSGTFTAGPATNISTYTYGVGATIDSIPTRDGYTFGGWCTDAELQNCAMSQTIDTTATGDKTFYAKWTANASYTVTYSCGTGTTGNPPASETVTAGESFTPAANNTCAKTGYTFDGWNDGTTDRPAGMAYTYSYNDDVTLTAKWTVNTYTITLENVSLVPSGYTQLEYLEGTGTQYMHTSYVANPSTKIYVDYKMNATTTQQYIFGRYYNTNSSNLCFAAYINANTKWAQCSYNGGSGGLATNTTADTNRHQLTLSAAKHIESWTNVSFSTSTLTSTTNGPSPISIFTNYGNPATNAAHMRLWSFKIWENNVLLHNYVPARHNSDNVLGLYDIVGNEFLTNSGTGTFDAGDPVLSSTTGTYTYGVGATIDNIPTREGYTFGGWCTDAELQNCAMTQTVANDAVGNKTFYAKWTANPSYTVTYSCGTGTTGNPPASETAVADTLFTPAANNTCAKTGYTFDGWNDGTTDRPVGTAYTYSYGDDITLTAKWTANTYTVTLENVSLVPSAYTQLEYLQSTGTQYIDTGIAPTMATKWELDAELVTFGLNGMVAYGTGSDGYWRFDIGCNSTGLRLNLGPTLIVSQDACLSSRNTYIIDALNMQWSYGNVNGNYTSNLGTPSSSRTILIGARHTSSNTVESFPEIKIYSSKIYNNGVLVQELIPARRNSDNVLGMYDTVGNTFKINAGSGTFVAGNPVFGSTSTYTYGVGATIDSIPTRDGYTFGGWCTDAELQNCAMTQTIDTTATGDKTFYAKWTACTACAATNASCELSVVGNICKYTTSCNAGYGNIQDDGAYNASCTANSQYTVTYACGTGTTGNPPVSETVTAGESFTPAANNTCAKTGYTFDGWNDGTTDRPAGMAYTYSYNDDVTLTAKWALGTYNITYTMDGGTNYNNAPATYTYGVGATINGIPTKSGYTFDGWTGSNGDLPQMNVTIGTGDSGDKTYTANWTACTACAATNASCELSVVGNICTYTTSCNAGYGNIQNNGAYNASCTTNPQYNITYTMDGGTNYNNAPATYTYGVGATINGTPTKTGYAFTGWCTDAELQNCAMSQTIDTTATGDKTFYAKWTANAYNITLENVSQVPSAYTQLEYLQSTGTQYIDTGYYANQNTKIFVDFQLTSTRGGQYMFGRWASSGSGKLCFGIYTSGSASDNSSIFAECSYNANSCSHWSNNAADLDRHQITLSARNHVEDSGNLTFPGNLNHSASGCSSTSVVASFSSTYTAAGTFTIFGNASANYSAMKLYNTKIWDNDVLSHNYVPVKRNSDNVLGLYDTVTNTFLTNAGTGTFDAGNSALGSTSTYTYGVGATIDDVPTRDGYTFGGWCTDAELQNCAMTQTIDTTATGDKTFYAKWINSYACNAGYYLPMNSTTCTICPANSYCAGGTYNFNTGIDQGIASCGSGLLAPTGMWESAQCGRALHVGDAVVYMRSVKKTTPSLNIDIDDDGTVDFFVNMTTVDTLMNSGTDREMKVFFNNQTYCVYDDTINPME